MSVVQWRQEGMDFPAETDRTCLFSPYLELENKVPIRYQVS